MPEGDAVWRVARRLNDALAGERLVRSDLRWPSLATADLVGATTLEVVPRGKHLLHRLDNGLTLHSHLRMDGTWRVSATTDPPQPFGGHLVRAVVATAQWTAVGIALGMLDLARTRDEARLVARRRDREIAQGYGALVGDRDLRMRPGALRQGRQGEEERGGNAGPGNCKLLSLHDVSFPISSVARSDGDQIPGMGRWQGSFRAARAMFPTQRHSPATARDCVYMNAPTGIV